MADDDGNVESTVGPIFRITMLGTALFVAASFMIMFFL